MEISGRGLKAILMSNPCNPTGQLVMDKKLQQLVELAPKYQTLMIMDEFYSHYFYGPTKDGIPKIISAAEYVDDVNRDPIIINFISA
jgi:aspartate/methionine/tyrosine aminotransferase